jgi:hypothetical protein
MTAPGLSTTVANAALATITGTDMAFAQLHTADPGTAGTTAVSSVTTRPAVTWGSASAGVIAANGTLPSWTSWAGTNGETDTHTSLWSASSSGTFGASIALSASVTMDTGDSLSLTAISITIPTAS